MKNNIFILIIGILIINNVNALQDSYLMVDSKNSGMCIAVDSPDNFKCQNQTLVIEGTEDHILYIIPETSVNSNSSIADKSYFMFVHPFEFVFNNYIILTFFLVSLICIAVVVSYVKNKSFY